MDAVTNTNHHAVEIVRLHRLAIRKLGELLKLERVSREMFRGAACGYRDQRDALAAQLAAQPPAARRRAQVEADAAWAALQGDAQEEQG